MKNTLRKALAGVKKMLVYREGFITSKQMCFQGCL